MDILNSYICGNWQKGNGIPKESYHAITGEVVAMTNTQGIDFKKAIEYARKNGKNLRHLDFHQRAQLVKQLAKCLLDDKEKFYQISYQTGATKQDSWIDIEGGINTMFALSSIARKKLPELSFDVEEDIAMLSKKGTFIGKHILTPKHGVVLHINSFNFPCWGMLEKIALNFIAGMPCIVKPATITAYLTQAMVESMIDSNLLPEGALQLICGSLNDALEHLNEADVVTFTGSQQTAQIIKSHPIILKESVTLNIEADSLNCCILGLDVQEDDIEFDLFIQEISNELSTKAGQRCTCIRRILVPENRVQAAIEKLSANLAKKTIGDPQQPHVDVGSLVSKEQVSAVSKQLAKLQLDADIVFQSELNLQTDALKKGAFFPITILKDNKGHIDSAVHNIEAFGPIGSIVTYDNVRHGIDILKAGKGSLVSSIFSNNFDEIRQWTLGGASYVGRLMFINRDNYKESTGHGTVMPHLVHGGPGRAGAGEELGGMRGMRNYLQRTALQGSPDMLTHITGQWVKGSKTISSAVHPFKKYYQDLQVGDSLITARRTVTEADIVNFGCLSGDHFYAHFDEIAAQNSLFKARVAHGYFVISMAAGLFVEPSEGPVLTNYGLEKLRFIEPVYIGDTLQVRLNFIRKNIKTHKPEETLHGVVYWDVEVFNQNNTVVANYEIITLVALRKA